MGNPALPTVLLDNKVNIDLRNCDCLEMLKTLPDASVDLIFIDPPYNVLTGHKIETKIDIPALFLEFRRVLKPDCFVAFYGLMPTVIEWIAEASKTFLYAEHIIWAKRTITSPYLQLQRTFENLFIYKNSTQARYYKTKGRYEDLKTPALHLGLYELSTYKTTICDLYRRIADRKYDDLYFSGLSYGTSPKNDAVIAKQYPKEEKKTDSSKEDIEILLERRKDPTNENLYSRKEYGQHVKGGTTENNAFRYRSKSDSNFLNAWAFLPNGIEDNLEIDTLWSYLSQNQTSMAGKNKEGENHKHPTVKPLQMAIRVIELLTPDPNESYTPLVLDCFSGSGTTALACAQTNRNFVGSELDFEYHKNSLIRINEYMKRAGKKEIDTSKIENYTPKVKKQQSLSLF